MPKIKALTMYTLGFLSAILLFTIYDHHEAETEIQVIQGDYEAPDYSLFAEVSTVQPKIETIPVLQVAEVQTVEE